MMEMKRIIHAGIFAVLATTIIAAESSNKPSFTKLSQAVSFIITCLNQDATNRFSEAFLKPSCGTQMVENVFVGLKRINKKTPLAKLYEGKDFPTNQPAFGLGGHFKELGCINIMFVQTNGVWYLADTYYCR